MGHTIAVIVIVGGGTAGWLTAGYLAAEHRERVAQGDLRIVLCESPNIPTVGVGEGTWPTMRSTLARLGISETQFMVRCNATFKQGSKFSGWRHNNSSEHCYYHPFAFAPGAEDGSLASYCALTNQWQGFSTLFGAQQSVCEAQLAPKNITHAEFDGALNYGYHLDVTAFGVLLSEHCQSVLGVEHIVADVQEVLQDECGAITALRLPDNQELKGDLFVDCTGFKSLLLGDALRVPFRSEAHYLFNDTALTTHVNYPAPDSEIDSCTHARATCHGWIWDIGLPHRRGVGHVFSSGYADVEQVATTLANHLGTDEAGLDFRKISFAPGRRDRIWQANCVAIGLSAGFVEPLEASALVMIELSAMALAEGLPRHTSQLPIIAKRFNAAFLYRWDRVIDFLKLHYALSERDDSQYWRDHRKTTSLPESLQELLTLWRYQAPRSSDFPMAREVFQSLSYQYVLSGLGYKPDLGREPTPDLIERAQHAIAHNQQVTNQLIHQLPGNRELINKIHRYGLSTI
ncbi:tryptophan 7-halogenase [Gilvimarinus agarilyticus]|uniref:tryptophan halogenase family protein n=1 Tax=Gilvimarinus sp. 2_MG-2023 TaxID=3062666 RepID=UPI001C0A2DC1|nr:tryptophan halogenase family protein [Gilvimarinus sp. 2_MG-2023]MBU2887748.1 tryptophan 7-halogenase [Gilvimarinus agarilyticus]MDO6572396.1 tryptophan 7-halogenase [Gilvimarinus sp. 2_MG-2023]